ncbi:MAG TPA: septal ring lytic transglycosylase RlpA family protein [Candidatus Eisenbacteria bacterium]|nr:septal ring lytic transglycosylase RlpA family protein [Candidatus Eisenbacteria bacterium]
MRAPHVPSLSTALLLLGFLLGGGCAARSAGPKPHDYDTAGDEFVEEGIAAYYATAFHGRRTASGSVYDERDLTAAHRTLPFGTRVRVTHLENRKEVVVTINDRGPFTKGRVIDLSREAAKRLDLIRDGIARVRLESE